MKRLIFMGLFFYALTMCFSEPALAELKNIVNPVADSGADPWVVRHGGYYYCCYPNRAGMVVNRQKTLVAVLQKSPKHDWLKQRSDEEFGRLVWAVESGKPYSRELWAPELHRIGESWYIYFAADDGENVNHRMYVLQSEGDDPMGDFKMVGQLKSSTDKWAIDGTVMQLKDKLYFIWSGWQGDTNLAQDLYIARMKTPTEIDGERMMISTPTYIWEKVGQPIVNEGPEVLQHNGKTFIIYSASGSWTDDYCLGQLTLVGADPMDPQSWRKKASPVFRSSKDVKAPGHASFVKSPDGKEDWIVYHAAKYPGAGWKRNVRIQPFTWNSDGSPDFGNPVSPGVKLKGPGGE